MAWDGPPPPYRIETERLVLRCYAPDDAELLSDAVNSSIDHLKPFNPWADDLPQSVDDSRALLRRFRAAFDTNEQFVYPQNRVFAPKLRAADHNARIDLYGPGTHNWPY